ncbi:hypothetical protein QBC44DRAFT_314539 [Cladorrhinum sp. PSN332]|nr:hypothetical protein QBC44DRAFT_314539 [Cladorrhinum sp. PSN332]
MDLAGGMDVFVGRSVGRLVGLFSFFPLLFLLRFSKTFVYGDVLVSNLLYPDLNRLFSSSCAHMTEACLPIMAVLLI